MKLFLTSALFSVLATVSVAGISTSYSTVVPDMAVGPDSGSNINAAVILLLIIGAVAFSGGFGANGRAKTQDAASADDDDIIMKF